MQCVRMDRFAGRVDSRREVMGLLGADELVGHMSDSQPEKPVLETNNRTQTLRADLLILGGLVCCWLAFCFSAGRRRLSAARLGRRCPAG